MDALAIDKCVLAGESTGVLVVLDAYFTHPERVDGLVLVDGSPGSAAAPNEERFTPMRLDWTRHWSHFVDRCIIEPDAEHIRRWARRIGTHSNGELAARLAGLSAPIFQDRLADVAVPTLVVHGSDDQIVPLDGGRALADGIPGSALVIIEGAGHVPSMTFPERVADEINAFFAPRLV